MDADVAHSLDAPLADGGVPDVLHAMLDEALASADTRRGGAGERGDWARGVARQPGLGLALEAGIDMGAIWVNYELMETEDYRRNGHIFYVYYLLLNTMVFLLFQYFPAMYRSSMCIPHT